MDSGLLLWLQLNGVNSYHKVWWVAEDGCVCVCLSVVMWDGLALRKRQMCLFLTKVTLLFPLQDLGQSTMSSADTDSRYVLSGKCV